MSVHEFLSSRREELIALRRELHQIPEVGLELPKTQARLLRELVDLDDVEIHRGEELGSIVVILRGGKRSADAPLVLLRGDMDALPVTEDTGLEFASTNGAMHACGHDLHMTILLGALRALHAQRDELLGDVLFMFQPGEESFDGAGRMLREGLLEVAGRKPDVAYAIHVFSALYPYGIFCTKPAGMMAAANVLRCTVRGTGGHGSSPHAANDPVPPMAEMITALQTMVTRHFNIFDPVVVTTGVVRAGTAANVIPDDAYFECTLRCFSKPAQAELFRRIPQLCKGIADSYGVTADVEVQELYPPTINDADEFAFTAGVIRDVFGEDRFVEMADPLAGSEDFSRVLDEVPGCFIGLSAVPPNADCTRSEFNHSPRAVYDDGVCADGAELLAELTIRRLATLTEEHA